MVSLLTSEFLMAKFLQKNGENGFRKKLISMELCNQG